MIKIFALIAIAVLWVQPVSAQSQSKKKILSPEIQAPNKVRPDNVEEPAAPQTRKPAAISWAAGMDFEVEEEEVQVVTFPLGRF